MRPHVILATALLAACAPPTIDLDEPTGDSGGPAPEPYIEIVHPQQNSTVELEPDCTLEMVVAVQIEDFELVDFVANPTPTSGEGHWHVELSGDANYQPITSGKSVELERPDMSPGLISVTATLVNSQHQPITEGTGLSVAEVTLTDPPGVSCPL